MVKFFHEGQGSDLTGNGDASGNVTVASTIGFYPGATCWVSSTTQTSVRVVIKRVVSATVLQCRRIAAGDYRLADLSAFLVADGAHIDQEPQLVSDEMGRGNTSPSASIAVASSGGVPATGS